MYFKHKTKPLAFANTHLSFLEMMPSKSQRLLSRVRDTRRRWQLLISQFCVYRNNAFVVHARPASLRMWGKQISVAYSNKGLACKPGQLSGRLLYRRPSLVPPCDPRAPRHEAEEGGRDVTLPIKCSHQEVTDIGALSVALAQASHLATPNGQRVGYSPPSAYSRLSAPLAVSPS